jgi:hypothetical protein
MITSIDRLIEIENERQNTMNDPGFQTWVKELGVSVVYKDREPIHRAQDMMREYDFNKMFVKRKIFSIFNLINN